MPVDARIVSLAMLLFHSPAFKHLAAVGIERYRILRPALIPLREANLVALGALAVPLRFLNAAIVQVCTPILENLQVVNAELLRRRFARDGKCLLRSDVHGSLLLVEHNVNPFLSCRLALNRRSQQPGIPHRRLCALADRLPVMRPADRRPIALAERHGVHAELFLNPGTRISRRREDHRAPIPGHLAVKERLHRRREAILPGKRLPRCRFGVHLVRENQSRGQCSRRAQQQHSRQGQSHRLFHRPCPPIGPCVQHAERLPDARLQCALPGLIDPLPILAFHCHSSPISVRSLARARDSPAHTALFVVPMIRATSRTSYPSM